MRSLIILLLALPHCGLCFSNENEANKTSLNLQGIEMEAKLKGKFLSFTVSNNLDKDLLIADDFCFNLKLKNALLTESDLSLRQDNFSNGIVRMQGRMALLKSHGKRNCEIAYFSNFEKKATVKENVLVVWHTNLFIGDLDGNYGTKRFMGLIPTSSPIGSNNSESEAKVDSLSLFQYKSREALGITE